MTFRRFVSIVLATVCAVSQAHAQSLPGDWNWGVGGGVTFPFTGAWAGSLKNGAAMGTHLIDKGGPKPAEGYWFGAWQAKCR